MTSLITVEYLDHMGTDADIAAAARVSFNPNPPEADTEKDTRLIRRLMRDRHTSPFEMAELKFKITAPIFVARQMVRHRTANWNELSGRYASIPNNYWTPSEWRSQHPSNKQSSEGVVDYVPNTSGIQKTVEEMSFIEYNQRLEAGVSRELARTCLPLSSMTTWIWKCDLHNIFNFLRLRLDAHAQPEIRLVASSIASLVALWFPASCTAFHTYVLNACTLSALEVETIRSGTRHPDMTNNEWADFLIKAERLNLSPTQTP